RLKLVSERIVVLQMLQRPAQLMAGAGDVRLDGAERQVHGGGDLLVRPPLHMPQHYAGSVLGSETCNCPFDRGPELPGLHLAERRFLLVGDTEGRRLDGVARRRVWRAVDADRVELPPPQMI